MDNESLLAFTLFSGTEQCYLSFEYIPYIVLFLEVLT